MLLIIKFVFHYLYLIFIYQLTFFVSIINIYYMQEGNSYVNSDSTKMSNEATFQLKRSGVSSTCVSMEVDFSPIVNEENNDSVLRSQGNPGRSIPVFNKDKNFFTPSFILQMDQLKYVQNGHLYQSLFEKRALIMDQQKQEMLLPKPSITNRFCCVCKAYYDDYMTHVILPMHKIFMQKSQFHHLISQMCAKFSPIIPFSTKEKPLPKNKSTKIKAINKPQKVRKERKAQVKCLARQRFSQIQQEQKLNVC